MNVKHTIELLRWPAKSDNYLSPWFVVAWRIPFIPLGYVGLAIAGVGLAIAWVGVLLTYGFDQACDFWSRSL